MAACARLKSLRFAALIALSAALSASARSETPTNRFGFTGPEIFPIDPAIGLLHAADLDGDGLNDLILVNNARSKINLLYNQTGRTNLPESVIAPLKRELNELPPDARFRIDSIASEKRIACLVLADLNGDGRPDIAYYGEPKELLDFSKRSDVAAKAAAFAANFAIETALNQKDGQLNLSWGEFVKRSAGGQSLT